MESLYILNERLLNTYGRPLECNLATWRISHSDGQLEKRMIWETKEGFALVEPYIAEVPKYPYIKNKYILERLMPVPEAQQNELPYVYSYEPIWVFEDKHHNPLPPNWEVCLIVINQVHKQAAEKVGARYKEEDPWVGKTPEETQHKKEVRVKKLYDELFGDESAIGDRLAYGEGVGFTKELEKAPSTVATPQVAGE